ncbi:hypothetical protein QYE76_033628 [Lolium multiflorum]|uniref:Legume lectin domain-containing protein n=1 Tax=Lolium multiflorum TaxID=4521 RepID=A0AAD8QX10_LOLMU|nr:hypothetical protein QYE76_033628 [Lolium multiflorum]
MTLLRHSPAPPGQLRRAHLLPPHELRVSRVLAYMPPPYQTAAAALPCLPDHVTSLSFNYNFSDPAVLAGADLKYMNNSAPVLDRIDLTNQSMRWSTGRVAHGQAVRLWDDSTGKVASFTSNFVFAIKPASTNPAASKFSVGIPGAVLLVK